jgi:hypothetical protein
LQVAQEELEQDAQLFPEDAEAGPAKPGEEVWTAKRDKRRRTSLEEQRGHEMGSPLRTSSSNEASQWSQTNS